MMFLGMPLLLAETAAAAAAAAAAALADGSQSLTPVRHRSPPGRQLGGQENHDLHLHKVQTPSIVGRQSHLAVTAAAWWALSAGWVRTAAKVETSGRSECVCSSLASI